MELGYLTNEADKKFNNNEQNQIAKNYWMYFILWSNAYSLKHKRAFTDEKPFYYICLLKKLRFKPI
jgi:hypothetical protein